MDDRRVPAEHRVQRVHAVRLPCGQPVQFDAARHGQRVHGAGQFGGPVDAETSDRGACLPVAVQAERAGGVVQRLAWIVRLHPTGVADASAPQHLVVRECVQYAVEIRVYDRNSHDRFLPVDSLYGASSLRVLASFKMSSGNRNIRGNRQERRRPPKRLRMCPGNKSQDYANKPVRTSSNGS